MNTPYIDHIGIIVSDLEQAVQKLRPLFGANSPIKELPEAGLRVAEFRAANVVIELLQYAGGNAEFAKRVMGERPGLNNISARVENVDRAIADLAAAGYTKMEGFPRQGAHGRVAFFQPDRVTGLLFEVCQADNQEE